MGAAFVNWLISLGLLKDVLGAVVAVGVGGVLSWRPWRRRAPRSPGKDTIVEQATAHSTTGISAMVSQLNRILAEREHPHGRR